MAETHSDTDTDTNTDGDADAERDTIAAHFRCNVNRQKIA